MSNSVVDISIDVPSSLSVASNKAIPDQKPIINPSVVVESKVRKKVIRGILVDDASPSRDRSQQ